MTNTTTMSGTKTFNSFMDYTKLDRNRQRTVKVVKPEFALVWDFKITYEMAKNRRKAHNAYLRQNQWKDLS